jgi:hypothetical protein
VTGALADLCHTTNTVAYGVSYVTTVLYGGVCGTSACLGKASDRLPPRADRVPDHKQQQEGRTAVVMLKRDVTPRRGLPETIATNPVSGPHSKLHQILKTSVQPTQRDVRAV